MALTPRYRYSPQPALRLTEHQLMVRDRVIQRMHDGTYPCVPVPCECGADEAHDMLVAERDRYGLPVRTVLCGRCGLLRTTPRLSAEATARFYDEDYRDLYTGEQVGPEGLFANQRQRGAAQLARLGKLFDSARTVYEIGCGAGGLLEPFAQAGKRVAGADLGSSYIEYGKDRGLDLIHGDAEALLAHTGEPADVVFLIHVLEHFLDLRAELHKLWHLLAPGGVLVVEVPGLSTVATAYRGDLMLYLQNAHTYHFCAQTLDDTLSAAGFDVAYVDESAMALGVRPPEDATPQARPVIPDARTAKRVAQTLVDLERTRIGTVAA